MTPLWPDHNLLPIGYFRGGTGTGISGKRLQFFHRQEDLRLSNLKQAFPRFSQIIAITLILDARIHLGMIV